MHHHRHHHSCWPDGEARFGGRGRSGFRGWGKHFGRGGPGGSGGGGLPFGRFVGDGELRLIVLALLADGPRHGYDLIKALEERSNGFYSPSPGVIYPTLTYLEEAGHADLDRRGQQEGLRHHRSGPRLSRREPGSRPTRSWRASSGSAIGLPQARNWFEGREEGRAT